MGKYFKCLQHVHVMALLVLLANIERSVSEPGKTVQAAPGNKTEEFGQSINKFSIELYKTLLSSYPDTSSDTDNIFFSPLSIAAALIVTSFGTSGNSTAQIRKVLTDDFVGDVHATLARLLDDLAEDNEDYKLTIANGLFPDEQFTILLRYMRQVENYYGRILKEVGFSNKTENARKFINLWVAKKTNNRITDLLAPGTISRDTVMVIVNTIYFNAPWATPFNKELTSKSTFFGLDGVKLVDTMYNKSTFQYGASNTLQSDLVELNYQGEEFSMLILLPWHYNGLSKLESSLTVDNLNAAIEAMDEWIVHIWLPKFTIRRKYSLIDNLKKLGIKDIFTGRADFSAMCGDCGVMVSEVAHEAVVDVNEGGTEASGATSVIIDRNLPAIRVDHPFIFLIRHKATAADTTLTNDSPPKTTSPPITTTYKSLSTTSPPTTCLSKKPCRVKKGVLNKSCCGCKMKFIDPQTNKTMAARNLLKKYKRLGICDKEPCISKQCRKKFGEKP
ncbi:unnamed protein product [Owenia fusiformis]|uniref:Uncharacterized protein n=1 Tax=Owenia fusiformis TaxID=6347 RepID=A0A8J1TKL7_OWEFU|nr:unnamed protein product [Owenia fusiformis]